MGVSFLTAEITPAVTPMVSEMTMAIRASCRVTGNFWAISVSTGSLSRIDSPRLPESTPPTQ